MKKKIILLTLPALVLLSCTNNAFNNESSSNIDKSGNSSLEEISSSQDISFEGYIPSGYTLGWHDEFSTNKLSDDWDVMRGDGSDYGVYRWGNNEDQYYTDHNLFLKDGVLHIFAQKERTVTENHTYEVTSARIRTKGKVTMKYGYIEARIKLPAGTGLWPAFWLLPENNFRDAWWPSSGEIDIMEARGRVTNTFGATVHTGSVENRDIYFARDYRFSDSTIMEYHCYGMEWDEQSIKFYIDGTMFFEVKPSQYQNDNPLYTEYSSNAPFDQDFHILLNLAVGGNYDGGLSVDANFEEAEMLVDYVRIYHQN